MVSISVEHVHVEPGRVQQVSELLARLVGLFRIEIDGRVLFEEVEFPFFELAVALKSWLATAMESGCDFEFDSMSATELGLVWIRAMSDGWRVGSISGRYVSTDLLTSDEIRQLFEDYIRRSEQLVPAEYRKIAQMAV